MGLSEFFFWLTWVVVDKKLLDDLFCYCYFTSIDLLSHVDFSFPNAVVSCVLNADNTNAPVPKSCVTLSSWLTAILIAEIL